MPYSYKLNVFLTQTGVVLFLKVAHSPPPEMAKFPPWGVFPPGWGPLLYTIGLHQSSSVFKKGLETAEPL